MSYVFFPKRRQERGDTAANLAAANEVLLNKELCVETDTTWPGGGRKFKIGDGSTAWNDLDYAVPDAGGGSSARDISTTYEDYTDFERVSPWVSAGSTAVAAAAIAGGGANPGVVRLSTGTSASASAVLTDVNYNWFFLGSGETEIEFIFRFPDLSTALQRFNCQLGLRDGDTSGGTDRLVLLYPGDNVNSGNWQFLSSVGGVNTTVNASVGPTANTFHHLKIVVNAGGTSAEFFMDGVSIGTTSAVPTAAMRRNVFLAKSVGTTARTVDLDAARLARTLSSPR